MQASLTYAYILIIGGIAIWAILLGTRRKIGEHFMQYITIFGGAFLLASCFLNLVPHIFVAPEGRQFVTPAGFKVAATVLVGFLLQLMLDALSHGLEHGHDHCDKSHHNHDISMLGLMIGFSLHAFVEGMPLIDHDGDIHYGLLYGIVLHNIPIAIILITLFVNKGYSNIRSVFLLLLFAVMTPLGSLCNLLLLPADPLLQRLLMGLVVGILLHVSSSILFTNEREHLSWTTVVLIIIAFVAAYFTPGCPEIYPS